MKSKRLYFRKKANSLAIEGKTESEQSLHIYTLGSPERLIKKLLQSADFFTQEKRQEIKQKLQRIALKKDNQNKSS
jgi:hypothetical protein